MLKLVTRESLKALLADADFSKKQQIVGRALVALLKRQTNAEQNSNTTDEHNTIGFAACDAMGGSLTAKSFMKHRALQQWQVDKWIRIEARTGFPRLCRYHRQLNEIANERQERNKLVEKV